MLIRKEQWRSNLSSYVIGKLCGWGKLAWVCHSVESKCLQKRGCGARMRKCIHLCRDCRAQMRNPRNRGGGRNGHACLHRDHGTQKCDPGGGLNGGGDAFAVEGALGFAHFPNHSPPVYGSLWIRQHLPLTTPILRAVSPVSLAERVRLVNFLAVPICLAVSIHKLWFWGIISRFDKGALPCIAVIAAIKLYLAEQVALITAIDCTAVDSAHCAACVAARVWLSMLMSWVSTCNVSLGLCVWMCWGQPWDSVPSGDNPGDDLLLIS